jgi:glucose-6-phosphate 1-dehydrogenase
MLDRLVVFGTGDLTRRYLLPALADLHHQQRLPDTFRVVAAGRDALTTRQFQEHAAAALAAHAPSTPDMCRDALVGRLSYRQADVSDLDSVATAVRPDTGPLAVYLALPPTVFPAAVRSLAAAGLPPGSCLAIEKPFGTDLASARQLNELIAGCLPERAVFRVDHFLGIQTVQNLLGLRFANRVFEPVWNAHHVERVDIVWDETVTLEGRGYYDTVGALRDMVQNHLLQLLALVAMEPPTDLSERELRDRKTDLLRAVRRLTPNEVANRTVRARYTAGRIDDRHVPAYTDEPRVDPQHHTETFTEVALAVDNWRWSGVPFVLRTGKALASDRREIMLRFRRVPTANLAADAPPNILRIPLDPETLSLQINLNSPDEQQQLDAVNLSHRFAPADLPAYARVLLAILEGDPTLSIRGDEAEESWAITEPILAAWQDGAAPLSTYPAGSAGPASS